MLVMAPALAAVSAGIDTTRALVPSQVVLSLVLPIPRGTRDPDGRSPRHGRFRQSSNLAAIAATVFALGLNIIVFLAEIAR
jgi:hypothetical protein